MLAVGANGTAIMAAIPTIRDDLGLDAAELEWAVNAYLIASAACIILGGKVADRAGARRVSLCGLLLFAAASAVIATAGSPMWLLAGRTLQGLGAAFAVPGTLAAVGTSSSSDRRASSIGAWARLPDCGWPGVADRCRSGDPMAEVIGASLIPHRHGPSRCDNDGGRIGPAASRRRRGSWNGPVGSCP